MGLLTTLRDAGKERPRAAALMSPVSDLTLSGAPMTERAGDDRIFTPEMIRGMTGSYLAGHDPRSPLASSPLFADPKGLPPLFV
jgi:epsilon-lactone hydrolase